MCWVNENYDAVITEWIPCVVLPNNRVQPSYLLSLCIDNFENAFNVASMQIVTGGCREAVGSVSSCWLMSSNGFLAPHIWKIQQRIMQDKCRSPIPPLLHQEGCLPYSQLKQAFTSYFVVILHRKEAHLSKSKNISQLPKKTVYF